MKSLLLCAAVMTFILSACNKESVPPAQPPKPVIQAGPAAVAGEMSKEEKEKAMEAAKAKKNANMQK